MIIGVAGYGYVGQAQELLLQEYHDIIISDPAKKQYGDLKHADAIIVCVSTPPKEYGECDISNILDVLESSPDVPILIKSTISVEGWRKIANTNLNITYSPEFLREKCWQEDCVNNKDFYFGGSGTNFWSDIYRLALGNINISIFDPQELVAAKALRNSFLALKVSFFNQVFDYCQDQNIDFEKVRTVITDDNRIGSSHSAVTEKRGYGGHCFPKDVMATIRSAQSSGARLTILEEAANYNNTVRKE